MELPPSLVANVGVLEVGGLPPPFPVLPERPDVLVSDRFCQLLLLTLQNATQDFEERRDATIRRDQVLVRILPLRLERLKNTPLNFFPIRHTRNATQ